MHICSFVKQSFWGRIIYHATNGKYYNFPEEQPGYVLPEKYLPQSLGESTQSTKEGELNKEGVPENAENGTSETQLHENELPNEAQPAEKDEHIIVDWDGPDDPENPYNWPMLFKVFFIFQVCILTAFVYMASAIYTPGVDQVMKVFHVSETVAVLPLTLFVFGYGIGPMVFSPLSENARFGRTTIYIVTLFIFFILQIPTALVKNIAGLCILRFIAGFFASPCLATGGASVGDVALMPWIPVAISSWSIAAVCAPSTGPLFGSILTVKGNIHWTFWFVCITSGCSLIVLSWLLPESYGKTILYRKAERLRKITGNKNIVSEGHLENARMSRHELLVDTLWRPFEIIIFEPVVLLINLYIGLIYSIMYLWFEAFPIVFVSVHHFTLIELGLTYLAIMVGILAGASFYLPAIYKRFTKRLLKGDQITPEVFIPMAIIGSILMPIGIFLFGWLSASDIHWIGPLFGAAIFASGAFIVFQTLFNYLSMSFYRYLASVFAGNDLFRSMMAGAFPLFARPLFLNLKTNRFKVGWGSSLLGFLSLGMIAIPVLFYLNGPKLRARSKYAT